jgi:Tfp pilus assembly protein PilO
LLVQIEALANAGGMVVNDINIIVIDEKETSKAEAVRSGEAVQEKAPVDYKVVTVDLMMSGDYSAVKKFLQAIEDNMRLIDVESILLSTRTQGIGSLFDFNVVLKTYYYAN